MKDMNVVVEKPVNNRKKILIKASALLAIIGLSVYLFYFSELKSYFTIDKLSGLLESMGFWGPLAYIVIYILGVCLFIPGTILTGIGAAIFGPYWGFLFVFIGAMGGASAAFFIGRTLGRDFAASLIGNRLKKYDDAIERNGFATVLYLRLIYFPFTAMDYGMGLTRVRFWDYFAGTGLGIAVGTFIFTFLIGTLKEVWVSGDWGQLISYRIFLSVALFAFSLYLPKIIKKVKGENWKRETTC